MRFRADRRAAVMWVSLGLFNCTLSILRLHKHGWTDGFAWFQLLIWFFISAVWGHMLGQVWQFEEDRIAMHRLFLSDVSIPYETITSVDWTNQKNILLTLSGPSPVSVGSKRVVTVRDIAGFLSQMEQHVPSSILYA